MAEVNVNAQKTYYSDDYIEAQLVEVKGDPTNGTLHPVIKIKAKQDIYSVFLIHPQAWNKFGEFCENTEHTGRYDDILYRPGWGINVDKDVWVKTNFDEYFRIEGWNKNHNNISVLRIEYAINGWQQWYKWNYLSGAMTFYDVPVSWEMPENLPTTLSEKYGVNSMQEGVGLYHFYGENGNAFNGSIRLESVVGNLNSGQIIFLMHVFPNKANSIYAGDITLTYKGEVITYKGKSYSGGGLNYELVPGQWNEIAVVGVKDNPVLFYPDTNTKRINYLEIQMGNDASEPRPFIANYIPIQWVNLSSAKKENGNTEPATSSAVIINKNGVGLLLLNKAFPLPTPKGTFYTSAKKSRTDGYTTDYDLYNGNIKVGTALVSNNTISQIEINKPCNVQLDNGIKIGSSLRETLGMPGVTVEIEYYYDIPDEPYSIGFKYNGVRFGTNSEKSGLTPQSAKKIKDSMMNGDPIFEFEPSDFKEDAKVNWFSISIY